MIRKLAVLSAVALVASAAPAAAQLPFRLGVQAGAAQPTGDFGDGAKMGYTVGVLAEVKPLLLPVGVRADVNYSEFGLEADDTPLDGDFRMLNINGNAILEMPGVGLKPYLLGGLGWYRGDFSFDDEDIDTDAQSALGFNIGGGIRFGLAGFGAAVEAHYRTVKFEDASERLSYIPISFVLTF